MNKELRDLKDVNTVCDPTLNANCLECQNPVIAEMVGLVWEEEFSSDVMKEVFVAEKSEDKFDEKWVAKMHRVFGHTSFESFQRMLKGAGLSENVIKMARKVCEECEVCKLSKRPQSRPLIAVPKSTKCFEVIALDLFFVTHNERRYTVLHVVDCFSRWSECIIVNSKDASVVLKEFIQKWIRRWGFCKVMWSDRGKEFLNQVFSKFCQEFQVDQQFSNAYSPWTNGLVERHNALVMSVLKRLSRDASLKDSFERMLEVAFLEKNRRVDSRGYSPFQVVTGRSPIFPGVEDKETNSGDVSSDDPVFEHICKIRRVQQAVYGEECRLKLERGEKVRYPAPRHQVFSSGDRVFYRRFQAGKLQDDWIGPGIVVGPDFESGGYVVQYRGHFVSVNRLHVLPAVGEEAKVDGGVGVGKEGGDGVVENLNCQSDDLVKKKSMPHYVPVVEEIDVPIESGKQSVEISQSAPPVVLEPVLEPVVENNGETVVETMSDRSLTDWYDDHQQADDGGEKFWDETDAAESSLPKWKVVPKCFGESKWNWKQVVKDFSQIQVDQELKDLNIPFVKSLNQAWDRRNMLHEFYQENGATMLKREGTPDDVQQMDPGQPDIGFVGFVHKGDAWSFRVPSESVSDVVAKRLWPNPVGATIEQDGKVVRWRNPYEKGKQIVLKSGEAEINFVADPARVNVSHMEVWDSEVVFFGCGDDVPETINVNSFVLGNASYCQQSSEAEVNLIRPAPAADIKAGKFADARADEVNSWKQFKVFKRVRRSDGYKPTMEGRWVDVWKSDPSSGNLDERAKSRYVGKGYSDPQRWSVRTDAPTTRPEMIRLLLVAAATYGWSVNSIDVKTAFLQARLPSERNIIITPPAEAGEEEDVLWLIEKAIYGLVDSPRLWFEHLSSVIRKSSPELVQCPGDEACFVWPGEGILVFHVDDVLWAGSAKFQSAVVDAIRKQCKIGTDGGCPLTFSGLEIEQKDGHFLAHQKGYCKKLLESIGESPSEFNSLCLRERQRWLRSFVGGIQWLACMTRPDASFWASTLASKVSEADAQIVMLAKKVLTDLCQNPAVLKFVPLTGEFFLSAFSDAGFGKNPDGSSQAGFTVQIVDGVQDVTNLIFWGSRKTRRVARSTLAAETLGLADCADRCFVLRAVANLVFCREVGLDIRVDCQSLSKALLTSHRCEEWRVSLDINAIKESVSNGEIRSVRWVPTTEMRADGMTKAVRCKDLRMFHH